MKNKERVFWVIPVFAILVGLSACSAQPSRGDSDPSAVTQSLDKESRDYLKEIDKAYAMIQQYYVDDIDSQKLYEGALRGMLAALEDPHSVYLDEETYESMTKDLLQGEYGGVGLYINKANPKSLTYESEITDFFIQVIAPIKGTPGYFAELHAGDFITHIDGESVVELTSRESVGKLTGEVGTDVVVSILRGKSLKFDVTLTRAHIEVPTLEKGMIDGAIGYLRLSSWTQHTPDDVAQALGELKSEGYDSLVIDLRENGGGLLDAAVEICNFFISNGVLVSTRYRAQFRSQAFEANSWQTKVGPDVPVVVLVDKGSASASEIFAGAMQDSGRAGIIGQTSYGKGSIQIPFELKHNDAMKLTVGKYYTPSGKNIDKIGIIPDFEVEKDEFSEDELESFQRIITERMLDTFVKDNPKYDKANIDRYIKTLQDDEGIVLREKTLKKLIKNKYQRKMDFPPVFDLEYDTVLQKAVELLSKGEITSEKLKVIKAEKESQRVAAEAAVDSEEKE